MRSILCGAALLALGCTTADLPTEPEQAELVMGYLAGDGQTAYTGFAVPVIPAVRVTRGGVPVEGVRVLFSADPGNGSGGGEVRTDGEGVARGNPWILGAVPGEQQMSAALLDGRGEPLIFRATAVRPVPAVLTARQTATGRGGRAGEVGTDVFVAYVTSTDGIPVGGVPVQWQLSDGGTVETAESVTDLYGQARATRLLFGRTIGTHRLTVRVSDPQIQPALDGWDLHVGSGPPNSYMAISGDMQVAPAGTVLPETFVAEIRDVYGNLETSRWGTRPIVLEGGGTVPVTVWLIDGRVTLSGWQLGPVPGPNKVRIEIGELQIDVTATGT